ncbi:hypothetical protein LRP88_14251 [Fusarium phalaenopsidis]
MTTTALSTTTSDGTTKASTIATTSVRTETASVTSFESSVVSSETSTSADTSESKTETASTEGTTTTADTASSTTSMTGTTVTTDMASTTDEATPSTTEGTTTTTEASSTTTTQAPLQPTVTAKVTIKMPPGLVFTLALKNQNDYLLVNYESIDTFIFIREGGAATLGPNGSKKLALLYPGTDKGIISLLAEANAPFVPHEEITCSLTEGDTISREAPSVGFDNLYMCGSYILEHAWPF